MTYIQGDLDSFDLWVEQGLLRLGAYLGCWAEFVLLHGD